MDEQYRNDDRQYSHNPSPEGTQSYSTLAMYDEERPKPKKSGHSGGAKIAAMALCFSLLGGMAGAGGTYCLGRYLEGGQAGEDPQQLTLMAEGVRNTSAISLAQVDTSRQMTAAEVYTANVGSTVGITTAASATNFWGFQTTSAASGSGFILSTDGYILTNYHVIEGADTVTVSLYSGESCDAALVGYDESNDIAVLKIQAEGLSPVIWETPMN